MEQENAAMQAYAAPLRTRRFLVVLVLLGLTSVAAANDARTGSAGNDDAAAVDAEIAKLIEQLGDLQYAARQHAQERLRDLGVVAFDALLVACRHEDVEIALRARYLVRSMPIRWTVESDPAAVKNLLRNYDQASQAERRNRMQQLARLEDSQGIAALCRLMRFETDGLLSRHAALAAMHHRPATDTALRGRLAEVIRKNVGRSQRPAAEWMRAYAQTVEDPESALAQWDHITRHELMTFAQFPQQTDRGLVRDLLRWHVDLLRRLDRGDESLAVIRRTMELLEGSREELFDFVDWLLDRQAWTMVDEVAERFPREFGQDPRLVYRLAEARQLRGDVESAEKTAEQARQMEPEQADHHNLMGRYLTSRLLYDWAEAEYRQVLNSTDAENPSHIEARFFLSDMLFDIEQAFDAAEVLAVALKTIRQNPKVLSQLPFRRTAGQVEGALHYYYATHYGRQGDFARQKEHLLQAIKVDAYNPDYMIAMYRYADPDPQWSQEARQRILDAQRRLRQDIETYEQKLANGHAAARQEAIEVLANDYNELAWLISNTEGDLEAAVRYSKKSLQFRPDNPAYLDTLGRCYYASGDLENAVKHQSRAAELAPYYQQIRRQLEVFKRELAESESTRQM